MDAIAEGPVPNEEFARSSRTGLGLLVDRARDVLGRNPEIRNVPLEAGPFTSP